MPLSFITTYLLYFQPNHIMYLAIINYLDIFFSIKPLFNHYFNKIKNKLYGN